MLLKQKDDETIELNVSLSQLKKIHVALFPQLHEASTSDFDALDEDDMLLTLQTYRQRKAGEQGVDGTSHSEWEAVLGNSDALSCEERFAERQPPASSA